MNNPEYLTILKGNRKITLEEYNERRNEIRKATILDKLGMALGIAIGYGVIFYLLFFAP